MLAGQLTEAALGAFHTAGRGPTPKARSNRVVACATALGPQSTAMRRMNPLSLR